MPGWRIAPVTPRHVRVRKGIPAHITPKPGYAEFLQYSLCTASCTISCPELLFDPEVAIFIDYRAGEDGWAHSLQIHPNASADYVAHRPEHCATRWLCRTADQDSVAIVEPGTGEPEGYLAEKAKGNIKVLPPGGKFHCQVRAGVLDAAEAGQVEEKIERAVGR
jgi:hypothetical protein